MVLNLEWDTEKRQPYLFMLKISVHQLNLMFAPFSLEIFQKSNKSPNLSLIQQDLQYRALKKKKFFQAPPAPLLFSFHELL